MTKAIAFIVAGGLLLFATLYWLAFWICDGPYPKLDEESNGLPADDRRLKKEGE